MDEMMMMDGGDVLSPEPLKRRTRTQMSRDARTDRFRAKQRGD